MHWNKDNFILYDQREKVDIDAVHAMLVKTYWAKDRSRQTVADTVARCLCFSLYYALRQVGFARVLTDYATYGVIFDVVIRKHCRGLGLGRWMMECIGSHPDIASLKQVLWTSNADGLYEKCGFAVRPNLRCMFKMPQS